MPQVNFSSNFAPAAVSFKQSVDAPEQTTHVDMQQEADKVELENKKERPEPPKIGRFRLAFSYLTDDQIKGINEAGCLPENAKFVMNGAGGYTICNNFFGLRAGTRQLPEGFEVRKSVFGTAVVLPKGMEGVTLKK